MIVYVIDKDIHEKLEIRNPVDNYDMADEIKRMFDNDIVVSKIHDNYFMTEKTYNWYKTFADFCSILFEIDNYIQENYVDIDVLNEIETPENSDGYDYSYIQHAKNMIKTIFYHESYYNTEINIDFIKYIDKKFLPLMKRIDQNSNK